MDFSPYQSRGNFAAPNQNYTDPLRVHADHSGGIALARESGRSGLNLWGAALQYKETVDSAKSMEANNEYNRLMSEGTALLMQKKQEQAVNIVDDYDKLHTKVLEQVQKKYKNYIGYGKAAVEFNNYTTRDNATRRSNMLKYQLAETDAFHETQFNNQIASCNQMVLDGGGTDEAIEGAANRMAGLVADRYVNYGQEKMKEQERILKGGLVSSALNLAIGTSNYARMEEIAAKYPDVLDPKTLSSVIGMVNKRRKEAKQLSKNQQMMADLGMNPTPEQIDRWVEQHHSAKHNANGYMTKEDFFHAVASQESGGNYEAENGRTGAYGKYQIMPDNWPYWAQEAGIGASAEPTPQNQEIVAKYKLGDYFDKYGAEGALVAWYAGEANGARWANGEPDAIGEDGHYSWDAPQGNGDEPSIREYVQQALGHLENKPDSELDALDLEEEKKEAREYANRISRENKATENYWIEQYSLKQQELINQGVEDPDAYDALALEAWQASGYSDRVRITLEKQGGHLRNIQRKAAERDAARESGTGGSGGSGGGNGKKTDDPFFKTKLEVMLRNGMSREQAYQLIEETNPKDATSAVNLVNDYFAGKEKYSVDFDDYKQRIADVCEVNKSDGDFNILYEQATDYAYELIMQYRDEHGGKDPTSAQITDYLIDGVTKTRIDTGERSWFGFGSPEYKESPLTPAEWFNRGVYNDPAEDYDADRGVYVVKTRRGTFTATEEQYQRIVDGEDADIVLSR